MTSRRRSLPWFILPTLLVLGASAWAAAEIRPGSKADVRGRVATVTPAAQPSAALKNIGFLFIEGEKEADTSVDKASVRVTAETRLFEKTAEGYRVITFADIKAGRRAQASFVGPVMQSYPVQAVADEVVLLEATAR